MIWYFTMTDVSEKNISTNLFSTLICTKKIIIYIIKIMNARPREENKLERTFLSTIHSAGAAVIVKYSI